MEETKTLRFKRVQSTSPKQNPTKCTNVILWKHVSFFVLNLTNLCPDHFHSEDTEQPFRYFDRM